MNPKFMGLEPEKRERIINAAMGEFAQKGYKNASTNEIVRKANISKGLLFHYFDNKKGLFLFLYDYSVDLFLSEYYCKMNFDETDIIDRWRQIVLLKIELIQKHPDLYDFMLGCSMEESAEIRPELESRSKSILEDGYRRLFENIDTSPFKEGIGIKQASDIIIWTGQGFGNRELDRIKRDPAYKPTDNLNAVMGEFDRYLQILKNVFYQ
ncbi:MAG: TetR/AcrR family transcriptional regulator [Clostridia bacterium]|nr:TetR/AcrR family transcriptional regulator [Clostridia bacterium]